MKTNLERLSPFRLLGLPCRRALAAALLAAVAWLRWHGCGGMAAVAWLRFPGQAADAPGITVKPGKQFQITLESNPTTGYQWCLAQPLTALSVILVTNQFVRPRTRLTGAPGREIWSFKAVQPGTTTIQLEYVRSWEKDVAPVRKTNVVVLVQPDGAVK